MPVEKHGCNHYWKSYVVSTTKRGFGVVTNDAELFVCVSCHRTELRLYDTGQAEGPRVVLRKGGEGAPTCRG
jgi:hypothetical protein